MTVHQSVSAELSVQFNNYVKGKTCEALSRPFSVRLLNEDVKSNEDTMSVYEPDISVICNKYKLDKEGCRGVPDLIVEILSSASVKLDQVTKFNKYEQAGVLEYWIVEPAYKYVRVFILQDDEINK